MTDVRLYQGGAYSAVSSDATDVRVSQGGAYFIGIYPSAAQRISQLGIKTLVQGETSSGLHLVKNHQYGAYALVKSNSDKPILRAWTFTQDDHDFYVLQMQLNGTLIYDNGTGRFAEWISPDSNCWRGNDGRNWEGIAVCCDTQTGILWNIDPQGRLDYGTTPIESKIVGGLTKRFRTNTPCYMAEVAFSENEIPEGIDPLTVSLTLRTSDTQTWYEHGYVTGDQTTARWYGLGLMTHPGKIFEITDTGVARRIDGLNIEVPNGSAD